MIDEGAFKFLIIMSFVGMGATILAVLGLAGWGIFSLVKWVF